MQLAVRSSFAAGVAIVGAGVLVAAPIKPMIPALPDPVAVVRSVDVDLSASVSPLVVQPAAAAIAALPSPGALLAVAQALVTQFAEGLKEAPGQLNLAIQQVLAGQITQALNTAANVVLTPVTGPILDAIFSGTGPFVDLIDILQSTVSVVPPLANVVGLLKNPDFLLTVGLPLLQSVYSINSSIGGAAETVLGALKVGDLGGAVNGVIRGLVDLQGVVVTQLFAAGTGPYYYDRGLVGNLIAAGQMIINALVTPAAAATTTATATLTAATTVDAAEADVKDVEVAAVKEVSAAHETATTEAAATEAAAAPEAAATEAAATEATAPEATTTEAAATDATETTAAEPAVEKKPTTKPVVRTGLVAVPGEVTVGAVKDDEKPSTTETAERASTTTPSAGTSADKSSDASSAPAGADAGAKGDSGSGSGSGE
jgi:hypothetical protein